MARHNPGGVRAPGASHEESVWEYIGPQACSFATHTLSVDRDDPYREPIGEMNCQAQTG
jgi:hypothetical protein